MTLDTHEEWAQDQIAAIVEYFCTGEITMYGFSFGSMLAMILSWSANHSILWAILHGFLAGFM